MESKSEYLTQSPLPNTKKKLKKILKDAKKNTRTNSSVASQTEEN